MALVACRECGKKISAEATMCPHCGVPDPTRGKVVGPKVVAPKKPMNKYLKFTLWVMFIGVAAGAMLDGSKKRSAQSNQTAAQVAEPVNRCFERGYSIASAYVNNLQGATEAGVLASDMMAKGCAEVSATETSKDCLGQCEAGFKHKAKTWLKQ